MMLTEEVSGSVTQPGLIAFQNSAFKVVPAEQSAPAEHHSVNVTL